MSLNFDIQANGWRDDGSESGVLRASIETGDLVMRPFKAGQYAPDGGTQVFWAGGWPDNADGSGTSLILSTTVPGGGSAGTMIWQPFWGSVFGVRWLRDSTAPPFWVMIDGVTYAAPAYQDSVLVNRGFSTIDGHAIWIVARDLGDGPHHAAIVLPQRAVANSLRLFGYVVEARAGYQPPTRALQTANVATLTTSAVGIYNPTSASAAPLFRLAKYTNADTVSRVVTIKQSSSTIEKITVPAGETRGFDPGGPFAMNSTYTHQADAGSVVTGWVLATW